MLLSTSAIFKGVTLFKVHPTHMQSNRFTIMAVDDTRENLTLLEVMLEDDYDLILCESGKQCLELLSGVKPDLVLLDVKMPDVDGYEVCRQMKRDPVYSDIPFIFVTAVTSPEDKVAGYEAGCDEYVTKPFDVEDLLGKISSSLRVRHEEMKLRQRAIEAQEVAQNAMMGSSELGILNQYFQLSGNSMSYAHIAEHLLDATRSLGLNCSAVIRVESGALFFGCELDSLEARLLEKFYGGDRAIDFQTRTIFNAERCSILAKNMPVEDEARYGRLKDHLATLVYATDHRAACTETIQELINSNDEYLNRIRSQAAKRHSQRKLIMMNLLMEVEEQLFGLGLDDDQEQRLVKMLDEGAQKVDALPDIGDDIATSLEITKQKLNRLLNEQPAVSH